MSDNLIQPYGGELVDATAGADRRAELRTASRDWPSWDLTLRQRFVPQHQCYRLDPSAPQRQQVLCYAIGSSLKIFV